MSQANAAPSSDPLKAAMEGAGVKTAAAPAVSSDAPSTPTALPDLPAIAIPKPIDGKAEMRDRVKPEVRAQAESVAKNLKLSDGLEATQFGLDSQKAIADFTGKYLGDVKVKDSGLKPIFEEFSAQVDGLNIDSLPRGTGWWTFIYDLPVIGKRAKMLKQLMEAEKSLRTKLVELQEKFERAKSGQVETHTRMEALRVLNLTHIAQLEMAIAAAEFKLDEMKAEFDKRAKEIEGKGSSTEHDALSEFADIIIRFMARIQDMRKAHLAASTTAPMIRMVKKFALDQISGIDNFLTFAMPEFHKRILLGLSLFQQKNVAKMIEEGRKAGDKLLAGNVQLLGEVQTLVAENQKKGIGSVEVLVGAVTEMKTILDKNVTNISDFLTHVDNENVQIAKAHADLQKAMEDANKKIAEMRFARQKQAGSAS